MIEKEVLLQEIRDQVSRGILSREDLLAATTGVVSPTSTVAEPKARWHVSLPTVLYFLGGLVVVLGVIILIAQNWESLPSIARMAVTLGVSLAAYITGVLLQYSTKAERADQVFFAIAMVLLPLGLGVTFYEVGYDLDMEWTALAIAALSYGVATLSRFLYRRGPAFIVFSIIFAIPLFFSAGSVAISYALWSAFIVTLVELYFLRQSQKAVYAFFATVFGSAFYLSIVAFLLEQSNASYSFEKKVWEYALLLLGLALGVLAFLFSTTHYRVIAWAWYGIASIVFYSSAFALSGYVPTQNLLWEMILPIVIFGGIFFSTYARTRILLITSSIALIAYIIKITSEYFVDSLGWPLALVLIGLALIGVGFLSLYLNRRYINTGARV